MRIEKTDYGLLITLPETEHTCEWHYHIRQVRTLNNNDRKEQKLLAELEEIEKPLTRKLLLRIWSMWNIMKNVQNPREDWDRWEDHNRMDFNEYYHDYIDEVVELIDNVSQEYCMRSKHGWCF